VRALRCARCVARVALRALRCVALRALRCVALGGQAIQLVGIIVEAARLALMQLLLQRRGLKLSPITAL